MFRYLGFGWNPAIFGQAVIAQRIDEAILGSKEWQSALAAPGLRAYITGGDVGVNGIYPLPCHQGVVIGRLFRRYHEPSQQSHDIGISESEGHRILNTNGQALIDDYWGRYIAVLRSDRRGTRLLRDPSGTLPCYCKEIEGVTIFFSWLEDLMAFTPASAAPRLDWDAIAARLVLRHLGGRRTALEKVSHILPGQLTSLDQSTASPVSLWSAVALAGRPIEPGPEFAATQLRQTVMDCTHAWASCYESILLRLSGGIDSAILLGSLCANPQAARITCLNYHSPGSDSDERGFARLAAAKAGVELVERERNAGFRLDDILAVSRTPTPDSYVGRMGTGAIDAEVATLHGARVMFTGAGGDQLFFQARCTWPAADYLKIHRLGLGFFHAALDAARLGRVSILRSMQNAIADQQHYIDLLNGTGQFVTLAHPEAIDGIRPHLDRYIHPELLTASDLPVGKFNQVQDLINPLGYYDPYLREAAPELVNPLVSQPLIELCLAFPTWLLTQGGRGRALARNAFRGDIPREIATRQSKGGMEEHSTNILHLNLPLARELLLDGQLARRGILDRRIVEAALVNKSPESGSTVGEIHDCIAIEAWVQRFAARPRQMVC